MTSPRLTGAPGHSHPYKDTFLFFSSLSLHAQEIAQTQEKKGQNWVNV